ncbi:MAG: PQQ-like beta-propeller repeat protein [Planctomycetes bacterium]|nr:PQQ-like beta-propeller repeat protein [Planctomycetota bacterium]
MAKNQFARSVGVLIVLGAALGAASARGETLIPDSALQAAGLSRYWDARLPLGDHDRVIEAHLVDEALYVITDQGILFSVKADVGLIRWARKLTQGDFRIHKPTHLRTADGRGPVVVLTSVGLSVLDRFSGDLTQTVTPDFAVGSNPVGFNNVVFMGSPNGRVYSLLLGGRCQTGMVKLWEVVAGAAVTATPLLYAGDKLLFATHGGTVFSCSVLDKTFDWRFQTGGAVLADPTVDAGGVYIASTDRSLYKLSATNGAIMWRRRFPCALVDNPVVAAHTVYQHCQEEGLTAVDSDSGEIKWRIPAGQTFVAHARDRDAVFTKTRRLLLVDHDTGAVRADIEASDVALAVANLRDDSIYLLGADGRVLCARPAHHPHLKSREVTAARDRLNLPPVYAASGATRESAKRSEKSSRVDDDPLRSRLDTRP